MTKAEMEKYTTLDTNQCKWWVNHLFNIAKEKAFNANAMDDAKEIQSAQDKIIKVLEQQLCGDAISREEANKLVDELARAIDDQNRHYPKRGRDIAIIARDIERLPSVTPTPKWIPVSERTPEELTPVNITWVNRNPESYYNDIKDKPFSATGVYYKGKWYWYSAICEDMLAEYGRNEVDEIDADIEITAWMPLPEPYKEGK